MTQARQRFAAGKQAYGEGRYKDAVALFLQANALDPHAELLFNVGQAYEKLDDVSNALRVFREYLRLLPDAADRALVEGKNRKFEARLRERGVQQVTVTSRPTAAAVILRRQGRRPGALDRRDPPRPPRGRAQGPRLRRRHPGLRPRARPGDGRRGRALPPGAPVGPLVRWVPWCRGPSWWGPRGRASIRRRGAASPPGRSPRSASAWRGSAPHRLRGGAQERREHRPRRHHPARLPERVRLHDQPQTTVARLRRGGRGGDGRRRRAPGARSPRPIEATEGRARLLRRRLRGRRLGELLMRGIVYAFAAITALVAARPPRAPAARAISARARPDTTTVTPRGGARPATSATRRTRSACPRAASPTAAPAATAARGPVGPAEPRSTEARTAPTPAPTPWRSPQLRHVRRPLPGACQRGGHLRGRDVRRLLRRGLHGVRERLRRHADRPSHCNDCDTVCPATQVCAGGVCGCDGTKTLCGATCVDLTAIRCTAATAPRRARCRTTARRRAAPRRAASPATRRTARATAPAWTRTPT